MARRSCLEQARDHIIRGSAASVLRQIRRPDVDLAVWQRALPGELGTWLLEVPPDRLPQGRILVRPRSAKDKLDALFPTPRTAEAPAGRLLVDDIAGLATMFGRIAGTDRVDIRLEVVRHDACWRFHRDSVPVRLLTTYLGPGTQFAPPGCREEALREQRAYAGAIDQLPRYAVAVFKGSKTAAGSGVVHRSPPVHRTGQIRLVLCLNVPSGSSPEPIE